MKTGTQLLTKKAESFDFFKQLDAPFKNEFLNTIKYIQVEPATTLISEIDTCTHLALVLSGSIRVYKLSKNGKEITLYRIQSGESCVLTASCILSDQRFPAYAKSEKACEILLVPNTAVKKWITKSTLWQQFIFGLMASRLSDVIEIVEEIAFKKMDMRIAKQLILIAKNNNRLINSTHQQLADELGSSREVISRILKDFEHRGLIILLRGNIKIVDKIGLSKIAEVL